jgi:hypothetical protein
MANMCVTAAGYAAAESARFGALSTAATIKQVVAVAQFALNAADAIKNFKKLRDVSSRGVSIEEEQQGHLKNTFWPAELQMLDEFTQATPWEEQSVLSKRYAGRMWAPLAVGFAREIRKMECDKPRYCSNAFVKKMQEMMVQRSATRANVTLLADRIAFYEIQAVKETDIERRKQVIAIRQGLISQAASLMSAAAKGFAGAGANAMGAVNNAISTFGHAMGERQAAEDGRGRDPYFHSQLQREVSRVNSVPVENMGPTSYSMSDFDAATEMNGNSSVMSRSVPTQTEMNPLNIDSVVSFPLGGSEPNMSSITDLSEAQ